MSVNQNQIQKMNIETGIQNIKLKDLTINHEVYIKILNIFDLVNHTYDTKLSQFNNIEKLRGVLDSLKSGIKMSYDPPIDNIVSKFALYVKNPAPEQKYCRFNDSCNELIFDENFKPLSIPPRILHDVYDSNEVDQLLKSNNYIITKINDGTMVTLYFDKFINRWLLSTVHKMDIGDSYFMGNKCYYELFYECINKFCPEFASRTKIQFVQNTLNLDLDINCSYTFIFHHKNFHPCDQDGIWQVQCMNLLTLCPFILPDVSCQECVYITSLDELKSYLTHTKFGFILRSKSLEYHDIIIRSSHLDFLRNVFYSAKLNCRGIDHKNRYIFLLFVAYLTPDIREKVRTLINVEKEYALIKKYIDQVVATAMLIIKSEGYSVKINKPTGKIADIIDVMIDKIGIQELKKYSTNATFISILRDYLSNVSLAYEYTLIYYIDNEDL